MQVNSKKVVFVRPPNFQKSGQWKKQGVVRCPLTLCILSAYISENGPYECDILDFEEIDPVSIENMARVILRENPKFVCFTTLTPRYPTVIKTAAEIKKISPETVVVVGGPHVTGVPGHCLFEGIDYGITGEGEVALLSLLNALNGSAVLDNLPNLVYRKDSVVKVNPCGPFIDNLDSVPMPAWGAMNLDSYVDPVYYGGPHLPMLTTRGCPHDCSFCASAVTWKRKVRFKSVHRVMDELHYITEKLGVRNIMIMDDTFAINRQRALEICRRICDERLGIKYVVQFRADACTGELVDALLKSGCMFGHIGVESGNEQMLSRIGKGETKQQFRDAVKLMKSAGLPCIASYIIGLPGDTHETIQETIDFAFELDVEQSKFMILTPLPGTRVYDMAVSRGLADPGSLEQMEALNYYDSVSINLSEVSDEDLIRYQDIAYERFDNRKQETENRTQNIEHRT